VKCEIGARQLAIEIGGEIVGARLQVFAHARALGVADLAEPAVLIEAERGQKREQHDDGGELPSRRRSIVKSRAHTHTLSEMPRRRPRLYISYKRIAQR
jgi:hypothetical protein